MVPWQMLIDRGGTFTDVVAVDPEGRLHTLKVLSEGHPPGQDAAIIAMRRLLGLPMEAPIPPGLLGEVRMGTTVATNALLTRSGARVGFLVTRGHGDCLLIGDQSRPDIFARHITRPLPLYAAVLEVEERIDAKGEILLPLNLTSLGLGLRRLRESGVEALAICLLHATSNPAHELAILPLAQALGFKEICLSHRVASIPRFLPRASTAVADAYLSPPLQAYTRAIEDQLHHQGRLRFMQSQGGLTESCGFRGKDAILSGPAGGIIGAVESARLEGIKEVVAFDMGGTSTDVSLTEGPLPRRREVEVEGYRIHAPTLAIHTVASGGGSICRFDGEGLLVGPGSAGADPGPMAYGRGGPLTITDANVLLGRIQPGHFPKVFGPRGDEPLDVDAVKAGFTALAQRVSKETGQQTSPQALAKGFLRIAIEQMARGVGAISMERGIDCRGFTLVAFGGAGGQHACDLAQALGMKSVLIHPHAGVLSAYGMGLADHRRVVTVGLEMPLVEALAGGCVEALEAMKREAEGLIWASEGEGTALRLECRGAISYEGAEVAIELPLGESPLEPASLTRAFEAAHRRRFGVAFPDQRLTLRSLTVEAIAEGRLFEARDEEPEVESDVEGEGGILPSPLNSLSFVSQGLEAVGEIYDRDELTPGCVIQGPAIIVESTGTTIIDRGWEGRVRPSGALMLSFQGLQVGGAAPFSDAVASNAKAPDPTLLTLYGHRFQAIAEEMGLVLQKTARSVNIKERLDFSCALFDGAGALIANAPHIPVHLGSMGASVRAVLEINGGEMAPGTAFAINDPYGGGTHLPDITVVSPVFRPGESAPTFFVASRGHHGDIGGISPGSMPAMSRHIDEEGVRLPGVLIMREGRLLEEVLRGVFGAGPHPARSVENNLGDIGAQVAANHCGVQLLEALIEAHGLEEVLAYMGFVRANAARKVRERLSRLPGGSFTCPLDDGGQVKCRIEVDHESGEGLIDFEGTSGPSPLNLNAPKAVTVAAVLYAFRLLVDEDIPLNEGCLDPLEIRIPPGCLLDPHYPAAVVAGNVETSQVVVDAILGAAGALAGSQGTMNNLSFGGEGGQYYETIAGGTGAGPTFPGASGVQSHMTNSRLTDPEVLEARFPLRVEAFALRRGSGGGGHQPGGEGVRRRLRFLQPVSLSLLSGRRLLRPHGMEGGGEGAPGRAWIERRDGGVEILGHRAQVELAEGDAIVIETPGGGGWGDIRA